MYRPTIINDFVRKVGIFADSERFKYVWFQVRCCPYLCHLPDADLGVLGSQPEAPVGGFSRYPLSCQCQYCLGLRFAELVRFPAAWQVLQIPALQIALAPFENGRCRDIQPFTDLLGSEASIQIKRVLARRARFWAAFPCSTTPARCRCRQYPGERWRLVAP